MMMTMESKRKGCGRYIKGVLGNITEEDAGGNSINKPWPMHIVYGMCRVVLMMGMGARGMKEYFFNLLGNISQNKGMTNFSIVLC